MHTFTFHTDPGHGWIECPRGLLDVLGIAGKVSSYSYIDGDRAFLEEDCDAGLLLGALRARGEPYELREEYVDDKHPIRNFQRFI